MKHRAIAFLTAAVMLFALAGCGNGSQGTETATGGPASGQGQGTETTTDGPAPGSPDDKTVHAGDGMPYIEFYAARWSKQASDIDLSRAASIVWSVYGDEMGFPSQHIKESASVEAAVEMMQGVTVIGDPDGIVSTGGGAALGILDEAGETIISISLQDGMIETPEGRYEATGLATTEIPGLMQEEDWFAYDAARAEEEEAYQAALKVEFPMSVFEVAGKYASDFLRDCTADDILRFYISPPTGRAISVREKPDIEKLYNALCGAQAVAKGDASRWDENEWYISFVCVNGDNTYEDEVWFHFRGNILTVGDREYEVEGLEAVMDAYPCEETDAIKEVI